jgi:uncharacterized protein (TIGR03435 family)
MLLAMAPALAQPVAFDAVSIKPASQTEGLIEPIRLSTPGRVTMRNYVLKKLLMDAYQLSRYQVEGPPWIEREPYDIIATKPPGTSAVQERLMLQKMIAERFHLVQHIEQRQVPAYVLLPGKDTSKLHPVKEEAGGCRTVGTMAEYAGMLTTRLNQPVVDQTGIAGRYYFFLLYSERPALRVDGPDAPPPPPPPPAAVGCPAWPGKWPQFESSVFDAVKEQMGLRLERRGTQSVNVMVLDRVEKPTPN